MKPLKDLAAVHKSTLYALMGAVFLFLAASVWLPRWVTSVVITGMTLTVAGFYLYLAYQQRKRERAIERENKAQPNSGPWQTDGGPLG